LVIKDTTNKRKGKGRHIYHFFGLRAKVKVWSRQIDFIDRGIFSSSSPFTKWVKIEGVEKINFFPSFLFLLKKYFAFLLIYLAGLFWGESIIMNSFFALCVFAKT
jgi:hypothetical protein